MTDGQSAEWLAARRAELATEIDGARTVSHLAVIELRHGALLTPELIRRLQARQAVLDGALVRGGAA